eukprot:CAMPEP_0168516664 /NCGR_PEP_ID=MMETSP0405-20121227/5538_1 /TAXON_ID=498012 /ORGANISM="Trichosphaerium sp, Strain Am-I-7 wt" /LENGTH=64 /DNA_ID=CAMNT_0008536421 /DNA_START=22 /DNA_END=216 /DNA_ORIENTATION=-
MSTEQKLPKNLTEEQKEHFRKYGRLPKPKPTQKKQVFDSADWGAKNSAGVKSGPKSGTLAGQGK